MKRRKLVVGAVAAVVAAGGVGAAVAAGVSLPFSGDGNTIDGCYSPGGALKVLTPAQSSCPAGFTPIQWNVAGPQGQAGPPGPKGDPGPEPKLTVYTVGGPETTIPAGEGKLLSASCSPSDLAIGGGFNTGRGIEVTNSDPDGAQPPGWVVIVFNPTSNDAQGNAVVQCLSTR